MSLVVSLDDYRRVRAGAAAFDRLEDVADMINAIVAERAPANLLAVDPRPDAGKVEAVRRARAETDRLLSFVVHTLFAGQPESSEPRRALDDIKTHLAAARGLVDAFIGTEPAQRRVGDLRAAMEAMFAAATEAEGFGDRFGQKVITIAPEVSAEVFLSFAVGAMRDQAGRLGAYLALGQREGGRDPATRGKIQLTAGRLHASARVLRTLVRVLPPGNAVEGPLGRVERNYFATAFPFALDMAARLGTDREIPTAEFASTYLRGLAMIDDLREAVSASSQERLKAIGVAAFNRAAVAAALTALVCLILLATILVFRRALFAPLMQAREQAIAISRGDLSQPRKGHGFAGEVGEMLAGLEAIRDDQRWRRALGEQQAEMARQLKLLSETDMLTGLLNRRAIEELAVRAIGEADWVGERIGLLLFDIDHFKSINDTFGHRAGDDVLSAVARELRPFLRPQDAFARFGGEEFLVLLPGVAVDEARAIAATLCERLPELVRTPDDSRPVTASFGLALGEAGSGVTWESLLAMADQRLYVAKKAGRARICTSDPVISLAASA